ncbi:fatty-acyl-CoA synthase [Azospirillum agricola]|uniref:AMP-binding protein n=1 Tax=Azospirillum agricola TaxID=1720247 RepID=UPI001AE29EED|nr:AMP-binding protein [Azospirillum agricola]MBP2229432.1 fatty-acyl-CoA synthase [Azospirillum agricola]
MPSLHTGGTAGRLIADAVVRFADRPALADRRTRWTYAELGDWIGRFVTRFRALGLGKGDGVAILTGNRVEPWAAICAANILGIRYTPLHPLAGEDDHAFILADSGARALIVDSERFGARALAIRARVPSLEHLLAIGPLDGVPDLLEELPRLEPAPLDPQVEAEDTSLLCYTGGTTGRSKGIMLPHRTIAAMASTIAAEWEWPAELRYAAVTPISHAGGIMLYPIMLMGGSALLLPGFDREEFCRTVADERVTAAFLVPTIINTLVEDPALLARHDLSSLGLIVYGAAPMAPDLLRRAIDAFGPVFLQLYGQSEAPQCVTTLRKVDHDLSRPERFGSCGRPTALCDVKLFDADMREVGIGEPGELCVRGPLVMTGYWRQPELTGQAFHGGWLHTGDVARRDAEGFLHIVDRTKDMIISGGFNIYPREVEDALMAHPAVSLAGVIGIPDAKWGEAVKGFVTLRPGASAEAADLQAHVKALRGAPWSPKSIDIVAEMPLTGLGKVDRKALREPYWRDRTRGVN